MANVSDIPQATQLNDQLTRLNAAIAALQGGGSVTNMTVADAPPASGPTTITGIPLEPPITDPTTIANLVSALQAQAANVTSQLAALGFT